MDAMFKKKKPFCGTNFRVEKKTLIELNYQQFFIICILM